MRWRSSFWLLALTGIISAPASGMAQDVGAGGGDFNPDQYPAQAPRALLASNPCSPGSGADVKDIPFRSEMMYLGEWRRTPQELQSLMQKWTDALKVRGSRVRFSQELNLRDGADSWWVPVLEPLDSYMKQDIKTGEDVVFYMSYVGCSAGKPVFAIEEFSRPSDEDLEEEADSYIA